MGPEDPRTKDSDAWLKELTSNAVIMAQRAREQQMLEKTTPINSSTVVSEKKKSDVPRGELPIDQVLQYINGEPSGAARKGGKKKTQKKHK